MIYEFNSTFSWKCYNMTQSEHFKNNKTMHILLTYINVVTKVILIIHWNDLWLLFLVLMDISNHESIRTSEKQDWRSYLIVSGHKEVNKMRLIILSLKWSMTFIFGSHGNFISWDNQNIWKTRITPIVYCLRTQGSE